MKRSVTLLSLFFVCSFCWCYGDAGRINWMTNYDEAVRLSKSTSKPIVLFFTGSDWCSWCKKLEQEALNTQEFADAVKDKFIFVLLDFPLNATLPQDITAQNKRLQKQFMIQGYPTLIILDSNQKQIGTTGYRPGGGKQYAQHLQKILDDQAAYQQKMQTLDKKTAEKQPQLSGFELKQLYEQAINSGRAADACKIAEAGMESDQKCFFLIEQYRVLAANGQINTERAAEIKRQIFSADPHNAKQSYYQIALIDFETSCKEMDKVSPENSVASLISYIDQFGAKDKDNLWRLQMLVSQVYLEKNKLSEALEYAEWSYASAPPAAQHEIASAIHNLRSQIQ